MKDERNSKTLPVLAQKPGALGLAARQLSSGGLRGIDSPLSRALAGPGIGPILEDDELLLELNTELQNAIRHRIRLIEEYWLKLEFWRIDEAACLLLGRNPDERNKERLAWDGWTSWKQRHMHNPRLQEGTEEHETFYPRALRILSGFWLFTTEEDQSIQDTCDVIRSAIRVGTLTFPNHGDPFWDKNKMERMAVATVCFIPWAKEKGYNPPVWFDDVNRIKGTEGAEARAEKYIPEKARLERWVREQLDDTEFRVMGYTIPEMCRQFDTAHPSEPLKVKPETAHKWLRKTFPKEIRSHSSSARK